jgi:hypothetical protein
MFTAIRISNVLNSLIVDIASISFLTLTGTFVEKVEKKFDPEVFTAEYMAEIVALL